MDRQFTTASQLVVDMQRILRENPKAVAELERDQRRLLLIFRCGGVCWNVLRTRAQSVSPTDFRILFEHQDLILAAINRRMCLRSVGLKECDCGNESLHIVADVQLS